MSNNRIYSKVDFENAIKHLHFLMSSYYCPKCFGNDINFNKDMSKSSDHLECKNCQYIDNKDHFIKKYQLRDKKISRILENGSI